MQVLQGCVVKRPSLTSVLDTVLEWAPWLAVWWGIATHDLWWFLLGSLMLLNHGLSEIRRDLRTRR